jgi:hypothetical protein
MRVPPYLHVEGTMDVSHGRNSLYGSAGPQSDAGHCAALVVQEPLSRLAWAAPVPGMHQGIRLKA